MYKVGIVGSFGKTASNIVKMLFFSNSENFKLIAGCGVNYDSRDIGCACDINTDIVESRSVLELCQAVDLIIDFSSPDGLKSILDSLVVLENKILISGTTGHDLFEHMYTISQKNKIFWAANMSISVALLRRVSKDIAQKLDTEEYDIDIIEKHNRLKKDIPSGTAISVAEDILQSDERNSSGIKFYEPTNHEFARANGDIYISSNRSGGIIADIEVLFTNNFEQLSLAHRCLDRKLFAFNTLKIAKWIVDMPFGYFEMDDFVNNLV
ncbi:4-hydroxy-tetrahydrodipicolinate reductase [Anaplasmataceae bacterium AB001_6]|nr:4-hydroxy-tetrahydrodipicolinate reductase [Anaplasmataceae bacterium AB001_6]